VPPPVTESAPAAPPPTEPDSWQALAHEGQFEQAYSLAYGPPATAAHRAPPLLREREAGPGELLLLADVARLSHHPADAVAPLSRLLREHPADPRAPLAAFTLGRVLLDELGRPREAAQSFLRAQELDPAGPLSQDALAREVEAWSRAGEGASARARALQYLQKYPAGRRLRSVRHFGELL
jgi:transmembrane sensor